MSDLLLQLYYTTFEMSPCDASEELSALSRKLSSCLGEKERELFENYQTALYQHLEREDKEFFLRTLALGIELGQLNRPMAFSGPSFI